MTSDFAAIAFGLTSALTWGIADFSGGLATRRTPVLTVVLLSQSTGLVLLIVLATLRGEAAPTLSDVLWGASAGIVGQLGLLAFYRAMAIGQMGVAAPIAAGRAPAMPRGGGRPPPGLTHWVLVLG